MKSNNSRIDRLKEMLALEERRAVLQQDLDSLTQKLSVLKEQLFSGATAAPVTTATKARVTSAKTRIQPTQVTSRTAAGSLRDKVIAALEAAGSNGIYVKELAAALGTKPVNIHSWFHSNIKRNPAIKKITGGHYRLEGKASSLTPKAKPGPKIKATKSAKAPIASKERAKTASGSKRGALSASILGALQAAGNSGINVRDLAGKLGAKYKNIYIWFATTGKKNSQITKIGPATYKLS